MGFDPLQSELETAAPGAPASVMDWQKTLRDCVPAPHAAEHGPHAELL
jgi:hypothetical protein